jgi:hypothetical protein
MPWRFKEPQRLFLRRFSQARRHLVKLVVQNGDIQKYYCVILSQGVAFMGKNSGFKSGPADCIPPYYIMLW